MSAMADLCDLPEDQFNFMKVAELRAYLKLHGQLLSGKKEELIRRAKGTFQLLLRKAGNVKVVEPPESCKTTLSENHEVTKLVDWIDVDTVSLENWPEFTDKEVYNYLVYSCKKTCDFREKKAKRQLKAHTFYDDRHVHSIRYHPATETVHECYIKCLVIPSAASSDKKAYPDHRVWLRMSKITGQVNAAYCTCTAGLDGSCNHVAALMYAIVDITDHKRKGLDAGTSNTCKWKQPRKRRLSPQKAAVMSHTKVDKCESEPTFRIDQQRFLQRLRACAPNAGWLVNFSASNDATANVPKATVSSVSTIPTTKFMYADSVDIKSEKCKKTFENFRDTLSCTEEEKWQTECLTRQQSKSELWFKARFGRLTSSHFGEIMKRKDSTLPDNLLKSVLNYNGSFTTPHTRWGLQHEPAARRVYAAKMKDNHPHLSVRCTGLIIDSNMCFLASSPDGVVKCSHCMPSQGILEIKCPSTHRDKTPSEACEDKSFFCHLLENKVTLKRSHNFYFQIQGQMAISGTKWCDFVVWTLKGISIERIEFDETCWFDMKRKLGAFYVDAVVPELFTERVKRGKPLFL